MSEQPHKSQQELMDELQRLRLENAELQRQVDRYQKSCGQNWETENSYNFGQKAENELLRQLETSELGTESQEKIVRILSVLIDSISDQIILFDENLNLICSNRAARQTLGKDLLGGRFCVKWLKFGSCSDCDICNVNKCLQNRKPQEEEVEILGPENEILHFKWIVNTLSGIDESSPKFFFAFLRDITEKKELYSENVRAAQLASLGELAAGVAHEINNPVNAIVNFAQLLEEEIEEGEYSTELLSLINREGQRIANIIQNLLNFAKKEKEECRPHDIKQILDEALDLTHMQMEKEGIWIENELPDNLPRVIVRSQEIQQVFINILSNSRYALNKKFPEQHMEKAVFIRGGQIRDKQGDMVRMEFLDKGPGIPQSELSKICDPFYSTKPKGKGTGLGLSISYKIIQDHRGRMFFDSKEGEYTRVFLELPVYKDKENVNA